MHFISITDLSTKDLFDVLDAADDLKEKRQQGVYTEYLRGKSIAAIFEKPSTRTRVSFEVAMTDLGGHALYINWHDLQVGRGETVADTAQVLSRYVHGIVMRANNHETVEELARHSRVPVINALTDYEHPCQALADLMTIREFFGELKGLRVAWIGDGNNVANSLILASAMTGMEARVATPEGYEPNPEIVRLALEMGGNIKVTHDPLEAARDADVIYTDVWVSMGDEAEREQRLEDLAPYQVNMELVEEASDDVIVMHCLPAHRGEEITDDVMDSYASAIFEQAENRLHAQKALLIKLLT